jgi:F-type H+-transporting ATPase subunit beta
MSTLGEAPAAAPKTGRVTAVHGSVIDLAFAEGTVPRINEAIAIDGDQSGILVAEVQQHPEPGVVRAVALGITAGLRRGTEQDRLDEETGLWERIA